jgi:hypothetical protein
MVVTNLESLVLRGVRVGGDATAKMVRFGSRMGHVRTAAFHSRHPSQSCRRTGYQSASRFILAESLDEDSTAIRAGRPDSFAGVPVSRSPAGIAGWAVLFGWLKAVGEPRSTAVRWFGSFRAKSRASVGNAAPGHSLAARLRAEGGESQKRLPLLNRLGKRGQPKLAWPMPACGMPLASTRGMRANGFGFQISD